VRGKVDGAAHTHTLRRDLSLSVTIHLMLWLLDSHERYPSSGDKLSPRCFLAPLTSLEKPPGILSLVRCGTDVVVCYCRHSVSRGESVYAS
jgi:hypothetical protein